MSQIQKTIKYLAIAFSMSLIITIISAVMTCFLTLINVFDKRSNNVTGDLHAIHVNGNVSVLEINVTSANIIIKEGDTLIAESNNENININQSNNNIFVTEKKNNLFKSSNTDLIIYVPTDFIFDSVSINSGTGKVKVEKLTTNKIYLELGAGNVNINRLNVINEAKIDGGAGGIYISDSDINNLNLDIGIGETSLNSIISGNNKINSGIGAVNLNLVGVIDDYKIKLDKGIGAATINNKEMNDDIYYGAGDNNIVIDGGIGSINIEFINK